MKKVAKLVTVCVTTRVIVDDSLSKTQVVEIARMRLINNLHSDLHDNVISVVEDVAQPYNAKNDVIKVFGLV